MLSDNSYTERQFKEFVSNNLYTNFIIYIDKVNFARILRKTTNAKINLIYCFLDERYKIPQNLKALKDELTWVKCTCKKVEEVLKKIGKKNVVRIYNLNFLIATMKRINDDCSNDPTLNIS